MIPKLKVYLDVDETTIETIDCVAKWYTNKYKNHPDYKKPNPKNVCVWDFKNEMPLMTKEDITKVFNSTFFCENVKLKPHVYEVLERLHNSQKFDLIWRSIGTEINIVKKSIFLKEQFPFIENFAMITQKDVKMGGKYEGISDAHESVIVDDVIKNLQGFKHPILFKDNEIDKDWNTGWKGMKCNNWLEIESMLYGLYELDFMYSEKVPM